MRNLFLHESKKLFCNQFLRCSVLFLLFINAMYIIQNQNTYSDRFNQDTINAGWEMYKDEEGPITEEKLQSLSSHIESLQKDDVNGRTYYLSQYFDLTESQNLLREMQQARAYAEKNQKRLKQNEDIRQKLSTTGYPYAVKQCEMIARDYAEREITSYYRTQSYEKYFKYDFSSLLLILTMFLASSSLFAKEKETGMHVLQISTVSGRNRLTLCKLCAFTLFLFTVFVLFFISDFLLFLWRERLTGGQNPVYSMPSFADSPLSISIGSFVFVNAASKLLGLLHLSAFSCFLSKLGKQAWAVLICDLLFLFACMSLSTCSEGVFSYLNVWNPICMLLFRNAVLSFETLNILSIPIYTHTVLLFCSTAAFSFLMFAAFVPDRKKGARHVA